MPTFRSGDLSLFYRDSPATGADRGEPILLIHGFASTHAVNWLDPGWIATLTGAGRRVIAIDNRGHGQSDKPHEASSYHVDVMAADAEALLDHLGLTRVDVMGYSMGARIGTVLTLRSPARVRSLVIGGLGIHLVEGEGLPKSIAEALEAPSLAEVAEPMPRLFRRFAEQNGSDLQALAACIRGGRQTVTVEELATIACPVLVAVGTNDPIAGDAEALAALLPHGETLPIPGRDHNLAVGDKVYKAGVLAFLDRRP